MRFHTSPTRRLLLGIGSAAGALAACLALPQAASAQLLADRTQGSARFEFNFSNPGARSLAMGGAFAALADDATAAYANPAGLTNLSRPEVSIEARSWSYEVPFLDVRSSDDPAGGFHIHTAAVASETRVDGVSFFSYVYPRRHWTFALYRHELANFQAGTNRFPVVVPGTTSPDDQKLRSEVDLKIVGHGLMGAYLFERFGLSVGFGAVAYDSTFQAIEVVRSLRGIEELGERTFSRIQQGEGEDYAVNLGARWQPSRRWVLGAYFRQGMEFSMTERQVSTSREGRRVAEVPIGRFRAPNVYGLGLSVQPIKHLYVNLEYDRIGYSKVLEFRTVRGQPQNSGTLGEFKRDDAEELRLGLEYGFWNLRAAPAIRLGAWYDPDHTLRFEVAPGREGNRSAQFAAASFPRGDDEVHLTGGFGFVIGQRLQIDIGFDAAESRDTGSLSAVLRF